MESSPKDSKKATPTRKRSKTNDADSASPLSDSEKEINIAEDGEAKKEEAKSPSSPSAKKKKSSKKKEKTPAAAPVVLEDKEEKEEVPAASIVSPRNEEKPAKEPAEALVSPRGFTRKRSDTVLSDFEDVLDVADEEGLTDDQVYITKVMRGIRKGAMYGETLGKLQRDEKELEMMKDEDREPMGVLGFIRRDYKDKVMFKFNSPTPAGSRIPLMKKDKVVIMTDYAPKIFNNIRFVEHIHSPLRSFLRRSGSLFVSSSDSRFIFKTIPEFEVETLLEILPSIHQHFVDHPESRIIRFLGLHHFYDTITKEETHCIVMNNLLLHPSYAIDEKWDLKGRIPKPGKQGRFADKVDRSKKVLKDNDLLDRRFHLSEEARDELLRTLTADVEFLKEHNCMDYSLLVGVHFLSEAENAVEVAHDSAEQKAKEEKKAKKSKKGKKKSKKNVDEREAEAEEEEQPQPQNDAHPLLEGVMGPIHSDPAFVKEIYFVGIIDPLSRYKLKKKVAHFLKEIIWDADTLSTVPADYYAERYTRYLEEIFVHRQPGGEAVAPAAAAAPVPAPAEVVVAAAKDEKEVTPKPEASSEEKEKKGTLKKKKAKKDKEDAVAAPAAVVAPEPVVVLVKEDAEEAAPAAIVVDPTAAEVEIKIGEEPSSPIVAAAASNKDGGKKKPKKSKKPKAAAVVAAAENGESVTTPSSSSSPSSSSTTTPTTAPATSNGGAGAEVEIKIEGPPKKEKKSKRDGTLKREKKSKSKDQ
ncbi:Phosphatidylinositol4-phosphate 5-Kinase [Acanthamoeba castellanii str. Neff]|uniref:Phosphatidylinositol4-phosphate 5-Kinase n=1 Tax=Acanthamoeba castellanii (strain ATCC 30010 / Neff) TaxID=1257118 RepID=L8HHI9_ACACF|nr:Phosphatidylinositol4-phosphate 5-Kinase [Acanthamoeba castellanii str. Neff]ELR24625.1 Phosphatidylinositol4-phosphate 5-Kinase [Acanthamoeba castellanii str. Neff]